MQRRGLGRGLEELLGQATAEDRTQDTGIREQEAGGRGQEVMMVEVEDIRENPYQPRREMDEEGIEELAESIKMHGMLQPIVVRRVGAASAGEATAAEYEVVVGERRWRAAKAAGLGRVPVIVRGARDEEMLQLALVENLQREDLKVMEEAEAYYMLMQQYGMTQEEVAEVVGKERATVGNTVRLLSLPGEIQEALREGEISRGVGLALAGLVGRPQLRLVWRKVMEKKLSVRATEELVGRAVGPVRRRKGREFPRDAEIEGMEEEMRRALGTPVRIKHDVLGGGGEIGIKYFSKGELQNLWSRITGGETTVVGGQ